MVWGAWPGSGVAGRVVRGRSAGFRAVGWVRLREMRAVIMALLLCWVQPDHDHGSLGAPGRVQGWRDVGMIMAIVPLQVHSDHDHALLARAVRCWPGRCLCPAVVGRPGPRGGGVPEWCP